MQAKVLSSQPIWKSLLRRLSPKALFYLLALVLISIFVLYVYLVNRTVMNVVARENSEKQIATISSSVGTMEYQYMALKSGITLSVAYADGFQDAKASKFIDPNQKSDALSYNYR